MNMEIDHTQPSITSEGCSTRYIISELLQRPFSSQNATEQKKIVRMQQPMPKLLIKTRGRSFQKSWYTRKDWLCASETKKSLFCWPYLLFHPKSTTSTHTGYVNMHNLLSDCPKHERANSHMVAYKMLKTFDRV